MMRLIPAACLVAATATAGPIDERLMANEPCADLPGISETESVNVDRAIVTLLPETAALSLNGRIACRTPTRALLSGGASVRIDADVAVTLADCAATRSEVRLSEYGGSLAAVVEALSEELQDMLTAEMAETAERVCQDLLDGSSDP